MAGWLRGIWISQSEHQKIVEELESRIARLESDFVEVAQSLIHEAEVRRAEHVRDVLRHSRGDRSELAGNVVILHARRS